jgi:peroxisomal 3,2-trans-enoyl-CoA isomerase
MENKEIIISKNNAVLTIKLNRPSKKNALNNKMLKMIIEGLNDAKNDNNIKIVYFTGTGDVFSSGNDFNNFSDATFDENISGFRNLIDYIIDYPKVLIAGVNGMCIGMTFSFLTLLDVVLCADSAFFQAPFIQTLQCPEAISSFTFPILLGKSMAGHLLLNGGVMSSQEAKEAGFVTKVYESEHFEKDAYEYAVAMAKHPLKSLMLIKNMITRNYRDYFHKINEAECKDLRETWNNKDFQNIVRKFVKNPKF